jgi:small-conductance mechanosensitive channel
MRLPVPYNSDYARVEKILLDAAHRHTLNIAELGEEALRALETRYVMKQSEMNPQIFWRLTDNWLEITLRFLVPDSGIRNIKSAMSRDILTGLTEAGISIASGTYEVVGFPPVKVQLVGGDLRAATNGQSSQLPEAARSEVMG